MHAQFLADICEHPLDDAPRLIYADWLQDQDTDPMRVELIRIQCRLGHERSCEEDGRPDCPCHLCQFGRRERELLDCHGRQWAHAALPGYKLTNIKSFGLVANGFLGWAFWRGFVDSIYCHHLDDWLCHGRNIVRLTPVLSVSTDRNPTRNPNTGQFVWVWSDSWRDGRRHWLPTEVFGLLQGHVPGGWNDINRNDCRYYNTALDAQNALSDALVDLARHEAELPTLQRQPVA